MTTDLVSVGDLVAGKYRVERLLGRGGMGVVVAAMHEQLGQRVALKMLLPAATTSADSIARFMREARAAVKIRGEHVARVLDVGELPSGAPVIVMEYLEGKDLADTLHEGGPLSAEVAVGYMLQACEALAEAHAAGIVHRDVKPSNVFVTRRPDGSPLVKVLDFGISKALVAGEGGGADAKGLTTTSSFIGSPVYAPPEQLAASRDVDGRADIWGVGTVLYEALCGTTPFKGETVMKIASEIFNATPEPLESARPDLPPGLGAVVLKCLEKSADHRYPSVRELALALAPYAPGGAAAAERVGRILGGSLVPPPAASPLADTVPAKSPVPRPGRMTPPAASTSTAPNIVGAQSGGGAAGPGRAVYALAAVGFVAAVGLAFAMGRTQEEKPAPTVAATATAVPSTPTPTPTPSPTATASSTSSASPTPADSSAPATSASHAPPRPPPPTSPKKSPLNVGVK
jgi:serine/threonine-protein kinase